MTDTFRERSGKFYFGSLLHSYTGFHNARLIFMQQKKAFEVVYGKT